MSRWIHIRQTECGRLHEEVLCVIYSLHMRRPDLVYFGFLVAL